MQINRIRVDKNANYTTINNTAARDPKLSLKAKGLLLTIMSLPDSWDFTINGMVTISKESRNTMYNIVAELVEFGYCQHRRVRTKIGTLGEAEYVFYEVPQTSASQPNPKKPNLEKPNLVFCTQLSTDLINPLSNQAVPSEQGEAPVAKIQPKGKESPQEDFFLSTSSLSEKDAVAPVLNKFQTLGSEKSLADQVWELGLSLLTKTLPTSQARSLLGKQRKLYGDQAVIDCLLATQKASASNPHEFLLGALKYRAKKNAPLPTYDESVENRTVDYIKPFHA